MPRIDANGIQLEYEEMGEGDPMILIMGIGAQLITWPEGFCRGLSERGFRVIRFDNRDAGLSTKIDEGGKPNLRSLILRSIMGFPIEAPYTLLDMADDVAGLMDALGIDSAHVVGASLGGMIAQTLAIAHPARLRTLTSIMSNTGDRLSGIGKPRAIRALLGPTPQTREQAQDSAMAFARATGSTAFHRDEALIRDTAGRAFDSARNPVGFLRQFAAALSTGSRTEALRFVRTPTLVIHGTVDALLPPSGGKATAKAIPGARLRLIEGMGHDLPSGTWPIILDEIEDHARAVRSAPPRRATSAAAP